MLPTSSFIKLCAAFVSFVLFCSKPDHTACAAKYRSASIAAAQPAPAAVIA